MILRHYQDDVVHRTRRSFARGAKRPLIVLGTGGGKTVIFSYIANGAVDKGSRVWIVAHRKELIWQAHKTLGTFGIRRGVIKAGVTPLPHHQVQVASIQTVVGKLGKVAPPDLIVFDEGHHATSASYVKVMAAYPNAKVIGVTATPERPDGKGLGNVYDDLIVGPSNRQLQDWGFLSRPRYFAPPAQFDRSLLRRSNGDFDAKSAEEIVARRAITGDAIAHYRRICDGEPLLSFCISVDHAKDVAQAYRDAGYRAVHVDGTLDDDTRDDRIQGLGTGQYQIVTSCDLIGEGLDVPVCVGAQLLRPTKSLVVHLQQIGRILRPIFADGMPTDSDHERLAAIAAGPKPFSYVLDHVGNLEELKYAETERDWSLEGRTKKGKNAEPTLPVRTCPQCYGSHEPEPVCPYCNFVYPVQERTIEVVEGDLEEVVAEERVRGREMAQAETFEDFFAIGKRRKYKNPLMWAKHAFQGRKRREERLAAERELL